VEPYESRTEESGNELEAEAFEFEMGNEQEFENTAGSTLNEAQEMELAAELLTVSSEEELDQFLGKFFKKAWQGVRKVAGPLTGILKGIAKKALPFVGGALGSFIPIPGVGTALGTAIGGAASKLLEVDLEALSLEDQEFEIARRFVRLASNVASQVTPEEPEIGAQAAAAAAAAAVSRAASQLGGLRAGPAIRMRSGRWERHGHKIVVLGV